MFNAKPKFNNYGAKEFEDHMAAVAYLNENMPKGDDIPKLKAEDWQMIGKLTAPEGFYFKNNNLLALGA